ncbi:MAG: AAA family ATPase [Thermoproteota archaeon]|nr:AAA family ATPase [Thermoproteota archaeon]
MQNKIINVATYIRLVMKRLEKPISTGCTQLNDLLEGGVFPGGLYLVYGEAETGKTTFAIQCAVDRARKGLKAFFVDSDGTFSPERLSQIAYNDFEAVSPLIILVKPTSFEEQSHVIDQLDELLTKKFGLLIVDTVTSLYREELGGSTNRNFMLNRKLNRQIASLAQIAKTHRIPVIITSQVRNVFLQGRISVEPVATRVLKFWSDRVIHLKPTNQTRVIEAVLENREKRKRIKCKRCYVEIKRTGIHNYHG